jgi:hypothetical protein
MVEVLSILAIATKEINQRRASEWIPGDKQIISAYCSSETFLKKLAGRADIEDALLRLEEAIQEEARMAAAESLKAIHGVNSNVKAMADSMRGMLQGTSKGVDDRVKDETPKSAQTFPWIVTSFIYV